MKPTSRLSAQRRAFLLGFRRAHQRMRQELADVRAAFEALAETSDSELRSLRCDLARPNSIREAAEAQYDDARTLH
jgi:hypothetical protein